MNGQGKSNEKGVDDNDFDCNLHYIIQEQYIFYFLLQLLSKIWTRGIIYFKNVKYYVQLLCILVPF